VADVSKDVGVEPNSPTGRDVRQVGESRFALRGTFLLCGLPAPELSITELEHHVEECCWRGDVRELFARAVEDVSKFIGLSERVPWA
jgi:hypothetical protein